MKPKVSAVVPVYNTEAYLRRCLDSIAGQTLDEIEIIIIDDGSPDGSAEIASEYTRRDTRFRLVQTPNRGVAQARNTGIELAHGTYIAFVDSDDYLEPDMLRALYESAEENGAEIAVCNIRRIWADGTAEKPFLDFHGHTQIQPRADRCGYIKKIFTEEESLAGSCCNKLYRAAWLRQTGVRFLDREDIYAEDAVFLYQTLAVAETVCIVDRPLYLYYQHASSESHVYKEALARRCERLLRKTAGFYQKIGLYEQVEGALCVKSFAFLVEILYNEVIQAGGYARIRALVRNPFFQEWTGRADVSRLSRSRRGVWYLYRRRWALLLFLLFKLKHGGAIG